MTPDAFLADLAAVYASDAGSASFGSGRLIAPGLILTAGHVVDHPTRAAPMRRGWKVCLVKERAATGGWSNDAHEAELVWRGSGDLDLALLRLVRTAPVPQVPPVFAVHGSTESLDDAQAAGFPEARRGEAGTIADYRLSGRLRIASEHRPYAWTVQPGDKPDDPNGWKGMSGAAVCHLAHDDVLHLLGVVQQVPAYFTGGQLEVARLSAAFADEDFREQLRASLGCVPALLPMMRAIGSAPPAASRALFRSTVPALRRRRFVGRADMFAAIEAGLDDAAAGGVVVLHGPAGVGKSELAQEFARRCRQAYPGGTFFLAGGDQGLAVGLARLGRTMLGLPFAAEMSLDEQAERTLQELGAVPSLLIYDNVESADAVRPWLPPAGMACHVLLTTLLDRWDANWFAVPVAPLSPPESVDLIADVAGREAADRYGGQLSRFAEGLPVQLVAASTTLAYEVRRGRSGTELTALLAKETRDSFLGVYRLLSPPARLVVHAATRLNPQRIPVDELQSHMTEGAGWSAAAFRVALDACQDLHVLDGMRELRMHQLFATFLQDADIRSEMDEAVAPIALAQAARLVSLARDVGAHPNRADLASLLTAYSLDPDGWACEAGAISGEDGHTIGYALSQIGMFAAAQPWFERAVAAAEQGDVHGRVDHASLGGSLYEAGYCLFSTGQFAAAQPWFERAVAAAEQGDVHGRVDHESLGASLHQVGSCLSRMGEFAAAKPWFERAVAAAEQGDVHGRVDHASLGRSLHLVGFCLSSTSQFAAAQPWYERAVAEAEQGDVHGRADHELLGCSVHEVGICLSRTDQFAAARPWFERAAAAKEQGDVHGRVDQDSRGRSLHEVGYCLFSTGQFAAAQPWFERAVAAKEQGDVHGRVDHESLGASLHQVGYCLSSTGQFAAAQPWFERAVAAKKRGDVHGRVDHESLGVSLRSGAIGLRQLGQDEKAADWERRAAELSD